MTPPTRGAVLSTLPAGRGDRRLALTVVLVSVAIFLAAVPFAKKPLTPIAAFIPIYESALVINDLITAVMLFGQFSILRSRALFVLASGYLFTAFITVPHALSFPGLFAPTGLLGAGPQTTAWLYMFWHGGFPLFVVAYVLLKGARRERGWTWGRPGSVVLCGVAMIAAVVCGITLLVTAGRDLLPAVIQGIHYTPTMIFVSSSVWALSLLALAVLWRRRPHSVLDLWLMVVMCAWIFDIALAALLNSGRWDLGFYAGRIYGLLAASFVLLVLLLENGRLYARLVEAHEGERQERQRAQQAEEAAAAANQAKSEFLSRMSHELRTPLNGILGFAQLLELDAQNPEQREGIDHILRGGRHLLALINEILDLARIESGTVSLSLEPASIGELMLECRQLTEPMAGQRGIRMVFPPESQICVIADRTRLKQVLLNLLSNAIKYNRAGGAVVVGYESVDSRVRVSVQDTGPGLRPEQVQALFQPFNRLGQESGPVEGTGIGLVVTKKLVELMGGTIGVASTVGAGSVFFIELKSAEPVSAADRGLGEELESVSEDTNEAAIPALLYVEDNPANLTLVEEIIRFRSGLRLLSAPDARLGIELARAHRPRVILMDLHLPGMSGDDALKILRDDRRTAHIPVIAITAHAMPRDVAKGLAAGYFRYLTKPLLLDAFTEAIDSALTVASGSQARNDPSEP